MDTTAIDAWLDALNNTIGEFGTALSTGAETALEQFRADAHGFYVAVNWHEDRFSDHSLQSSVPATYCRFPKIAARVRKLFFT